MVDYEYKNVNGENIKLTDAEIKELQDRDTAYASKSGERKLAEIKDIRLQKLKETDYIALSDVTMSDAVKTWRQSLRDLPQNNTTESKYDELLARDSNGNLTNSIWTQPS
tara:strand:- start:383 stop:712 length:330 start_codon:yes stop_codon:yes gene_type:complete